MPETNSGWFLTSPNDIVFRRRGDPLGLRNVNDEASELLAPGLTNRTLDARWLSLLSWSLVQSHRAWGGSGSLRTSDERWRRYEWLRPLELLWVARTIIVNGRGYRALHWPGYQAISGWLYDKKSSNFGMTEHQLRNYRPLGAYGSYRVVLKSPGFTINSDGWTPGNGAIALSQIVDARLETEGAKTSWTNKPQHSDPAQWWLTKGWKNWQKSGCCSHLLLSPNGEPDRLLKEERAVLRPILFSDKCDRHRTVEAMSKSSDASTYEELCNRLADELPSQGGSKKLKSLGRLAELNQAGLEIMRAMATCLIAHRKSSGNMALALTKLASDETVQATADRFCKASDQWTTRLQDGDGFTNNVDACSVAAIATSARTTKSLLKALARHHVDNGSGLKWFEVDGERLNLVGAESGSDAGNYGYRLHALASLAVQCGVMTQRPKALQSTRDDIDSDRQDEV